MRANAARKAPTWSGLRPTQPWVSRAQVVAASRKAVRSSRLRGVVNSRFTVAPVSASVVVMPDAGSAAMSNSVAIVFAIGANAGWCATSSTGRPST